MEFIGSEIENDGVGGNFFRSVFKLEKFSIYFFIHGIGDNKQFNISNYTKDMLEKLLTGNYPSKKIICEYIKKYYLVSFRIECYHVGYSGFNIIIHLNYKA